MVFRIPDGVEGSKRGYHNELFESPELSLRFFLLVIRFIEGSVQAEQTLTKPVIRDLHDQCKPNETDNSFATTI